MASCVASCRPVAAPDQLQGSHRLVGGGGGERCRGRDDPLLVELVKIRTSQINGYAFCLRMHTRDALKKGESTDRLAVLPAWAETGYFSEPERAALRLTEAIARVSDGHVSDADYAAAAAVLSEDQVSAVAWLSTVMNAFNRVAITSRYTVAGD